VITGFCKSTLGGCCRFADDVLLLLVLKATLCRKKEMRWHTNDVWCHQRTKSLQPCMCILPTRPQWRTKSGTRML